MKQLNYIKPEIFNIISNILGKKEQQGFVIGGYVRDQILGRPTKDIDVVVLGSGIDLAKEVAASLGKDVNVAVFKNFGTAMIRHKDLEIEFVGARKESYNRESRKPVVENGTLEEDQQRRDFTINAMAIALHPSEYGTLIDPFNGMADIRSKIIQTPLDPQRTFSDDPLRMIRGIRFATQLHFRLSDKTYHAICEHAERIKIVSHERIVDEVNKILMTDQPSIGLSLLYKTGLLAYFFPELAQLKGVETKSGKSHKDNFLHTIQVVDNISPNTNNLWLKWAALLHDIAKPTTKQFDDQHGWTFHGHDFIGAKMIPQLFRKLKMPLNEKMKYVQKMVRLHLRPIALVTDKVTDSAVRRLLFEAGDDVDDLMTLCEADITSSFENKVKRFRKNFTKVRKKLNEIEEKDKIRNFQPPVTGDEVMKTFNIKPGKEVGIIKNAIKEAILEGQIQNNYDEAYHFMLSKGQELGLEAKNNPRK